MDDLDDFIAEQFRDPVFARAYEFAEAVAWHRAWHRAWRHGFVAGLVLDLAAIAIVLVMLQ